MRLKKDVRRDGGADLVGYHLREARVRVLADVRIGSAVESALLNTDEIVGHQAVTEAIAFLHDSVEFPGIGMNCEGRRIPHSRRKCHLVFAVLVKPLNRRLRFWFNPEVSRGAHSNE